MQSSAEKIGREGREKSKAGALLRALWGCEDCWETCYSLSELWTPAVQRAQLLSFRGFSLSALTGLSVWCWRQPGFDEKTQQPA